MKQKLKILGLLNLIELKAIAARSSFLACFHITCFRVLQSHFFFCVLCLWGWPDSLESARSPIVLLSGAVVRLFKKWAKKKYKLNEMCQSQLFPENKHANSNSKININGQFHIALVGC